VSLERIRLQDAAGRKSVQRGPVGFFGALRFRTSVGAMFARAGLGCSFAMWVESWFMDTWAPQKRQSALPGEM
jgi:hypothetical protein